MTRQPTVAIAHDYLTQRGGAERVVLSLMRAFPGAPVHTTLYDPDGTYPDWDPAALYDQGDRVMWEGTGYEARWWSQGKRPDRSVLDRDYSPWKMLTEP